MSQENQANNVRWGWLRFMYLYTFLVAGGLGLAMVVVPDVIRSSFALPAQDPINFGIVGSVYLAFGLVSLLGLRAPLTFAPVLLLQLTYKLIWWVAVILPLLVSGTLPAYAVPTVVVFTTFIAGDLIAIPFSRILTIQAPRLAHGSTHP